MSMATPSANRKSVVTRWLLRLFSYDGVLPALVFLIPGLLSVAIGAGAIIELTAVALPIIAYFWRMAIGLRHIETNGCSRIVRRIQKCWLFVGLLALLLVDAFMILTWNIPRNALSVQDYITTFYIYLVYVLCLAVSTYPGRYRFIPEENLRHA